MRTSYAAAPIWIRVLLKKSPMVDTDIIEYVNGDDMSSIAVFSECMKYRYFLTRRWNTKLPNITYVMLNPSTADAFKNDPTVARCQERATKLGFGSFTVANIFSFRSTQPNAMKLPNISPIGEDNDSWIQFAARQAKKVVIGWGNHGKWMGRGDIVVDLLDGIELFCLEQNKGGCPAHPLYISYDRPLRRYMQTVI